MKNNFKLQFLHILVLIYTFTIDFNFYKRRFDDISSFQGMMAALVVGVKHIMPDGTIGIGTAVLPYIRAKVANKYACSVL